jgi:hypothetical protein
MTEEEQVSKNIRDRAVYEQTGYWPDDDEATE